MNDPLALAHRSWARALWALCYRMTGVAADADELVQETFVRALESKPSNAESLRPWLFSIATRLCIDRLRRRKVEGYKGPWLPSPVPDESLTFEAPASARYEVMESASFAFLLALEALSAEQRAALVLGDVFDLPAKEVAVHLETSEANVRQLQHRARAALERYDANRVVIDDASRERTRVALEGFFTALASGDAAGARAWLADDVQTITDGGGEFFASLVPLLGPDRSMLFLSRLIELRGLPVTSEIKSFNGAYALEATFDQRAPKEPPHAVNGVLVNAEGKIALLYAVVSSRKLWRAHEAASVDPSIDPRLQ